MTFSVVVEDALMAMIVCFETIIGIIIARSSFARFTAERVIASSILPQNIDCDDDDDSNDDVAAHCAACVLSN